MPDFMYVALKGDDRISIFSIQPDSGKLDLLRHQEVPGGPAPLTMDPDRKFLYVAQRNSLEVSTFRVDPAAGGLSLLGTSPLQGDPCYLSTDRTGRYLLSAYYFAGRVAVHPIGEDGVAYGPPIEWLSTDIGAHCLQTDPSNRYAFVPHIAFAPTLNRKGPNAVFQFKFDQSTGHITPNSTPRAQPEDGLGPRHFCFHPSMDIIYTSNEQACSVTRYDFDPSVGTLNPTQTVSTLPPEGFEEYTSCSQIQITPSGRFLYVPNRGHNSIACFAVDGANGELTSIGQAPTEAVPRAFSLDPQGQFLYAAGLEAGRLASYRIKDDTGELEPMEVYSVGKEPMWVLTTRLPG